MRYIISLLMASALPALAPALTLAEVPRVMTDIPPVHALASQVMGDLGQPELLLYPGASEHDFQLRPSQAASLADAGLILWVGPDLTPWLDRAVDALGDGTPSLTLLNAPGTETRTYADVAAHDDHAAENKEEAAHDHDDAHGHDGTDPHAWLDPANAKVWLGVIAAELARLDPANAATYAANAAAAQAGLDALDAELATILAPAKGQLLVTAHEAYGYFAAHYGLTLAGAAALGDATAPGAARLTALEDGLRAAPGTCLFPEPQHDPAILLQLAEATGARVGGALDPTGSTLTAGPEAYAALMRGMATTIAACAAP